MARYFRFPWAQDGDKTDIPDTTQGSGAVSYQQGYGAAYAADPATDPSSRDIEREMYNQALFDITGTLQQYYQRGVPPFITSANNGGVAFNYQQYARVIFNNRVYESLINNNATEPSNTSNWRLVDFAGLDARYGLGSTTPLVTGTSAGNVPLIGTPGTTVAGGNSAVIVRAGSNANGFYRISSDNLLLMFGSGAFAVGQNNLTVTFPINTSGFSRRVIGAFYNGASSSLTLDRSLTTTSPTVSTFVVTALRNQPGSTQQTFYWLAIYT